jgi:hypothetical protein
MMNTLVDALFLASEVVVTASILAHFFSNFSQVPDPQPRYYQG